MELAPQQLTFDYSGYSEEFKLKSYERKARIKTNEQVATKAFYDIAQDVKAQHDDMGNYQEWLKWCDTELGYKKNMACSFLKIGTEIGAELRTKNLPTSHSALDTLARALSNAHEETKDQILDQVQQATEEKGKPLTEKEIKELPLVQKIQEEKLQLEQEKKDLKDQQLKLLKDRDRANENATRFSSLYGQEIDKAKEMSKENIQLKEQLKELEKLKAEKEELKQKMAKELKNQVELAIKESTAEVEQKKTATRKRITELEIELSKLEAEKENLEFYADQAQKRLDVNRDMEKRHHTLAQILQKFEDISRSMQAEQRYILATPTPELMTSYKALAGQFRLWAEIMEDAIASMEDTHQGIIDITGI